MILSVYLQFLCQTNAIWDTKDLTKLKTLNYHGRFTSRFSSARAIAGIIIEFICGSTINCMTPDNVAMLEYL